MLKKLSSLILAVAILVTVCPATFAEGDFLSTYVGTVYGESAPIIKNDGTVTTIEAENYDNGGKDVAYYSETTEEATIKRVGDYVKFQDRGIQYYGCAGWQNYTVEVEEAGSYRIDAWWMNQTGARYLIKVNGETAISSSFAYISPKNADGQLTYSRQYAGTVELLAGKNVITFVVENGTSGYFIFDYMQIQKEKPGAFVDVTLSSDAKTTVEAAKYDAGGCYDAIANPDGAWYNTNTTMTNTTRPEDHVWFYNGDFVRVFANGEWANFTVNVATAGYYDLTIYGYKNNANAYPSINVYTNGVKKVSSSVAEAGVYSWSTVDLGGIWLEEGENVLKVEVTGNYFFWQFMTFTYETAEADFLDIYNGTPYGGTAITVASDGTAATIQAENYDEGGRGVAYETESETLSTVNRTNEYVPTADRGISYTNCASWQNYTIEAEAAGKYRVDICTYGTGGDKNNFYMNVNGEEAIPDTNILATKNSEGNYEYKTQFAGYIDLDEGKNVITFGLKEGASFLILDYFTVSAVVGSEGFLLSYTGTPFGGSAMSVKNDGTVTRIQAENYDNGGKNVAYYSETTTAATAMRVGDYVPFQDRGIQYYSYAGWQNYTVEAEEAGSYRLDACWWSAGATGNRYVIKVNGETVISNSFAYSTSNAYANQYVGTVELLKGKNVITFEVENAVNNYYIFDYLEIQKEKSGPFKNVTLSSEAQASVWAAYYDIGGCYDAETNPDGAWYNTNTALTNTYRTQDHVSWYGSDMWKRPFFSGEWANYTVTVADPGWYSVSLVEAFRNGETSPVLNIYVDGELQIAYDASQLNVNANTTVDIGLIELKRPNSVIKVEASGNTIIWQRMTFTYDNVNNLLAPFSGICVDITDSDENVIIELSDETEISANVHYQNTSDSLETMVMVVALYEDGRLIGVKSKDISAEAGTFKTYSLDDTISFTKKTESQYEAKCIVLNTLSGLTPILEEAASVK